MTSVYFQGIAKQILGDETQIESTFESFSNGQLTEAQAQDKIMELANDARGCAQDLPDYSPTSPSANLAQQILNNLDVLGILTPALESGDLTALEKDVQYSESYYQQVVNSGQVPDSDQVKKLEAQQIVNNIDEVESMVQNGNMQEILDLVNDSVQYANNLPTSGITGTLRSFDDPNQLREAMTPQNEPLFLGDLTLICNYYQSLAN